MQITKELIEVLLNRFSAVGEEKNNWLQSTKDKFDQIRMVILWENISKIVAFGRKYDADFERIVHSLAGDFTLKFKRCYNAKSFVEIIHEEYLKYRLAELEVVKPKDLLIILKDIRGRYDYFNNLIEEDLDIKNQLEQILR